MENLIKGQEYYFLSDSDYAGLQTALNGTSFQLADFGFVLHVESGPFAGYYALLDSIDPDEFDFLAENFESFDNPIINLSIQASYVG